MIPTDVVHRQQREKALQRKVVQLCEQCDVDVYSTSQVRPSMVSEGIADLIAFSALRGVAFIETKDKGRKQSAAQIRFQRSCEKANVPYILAYNVEVVRDWLGAKK